MGPDHTLEILTGIVNVPRRSSPWGFSSLWRLTAGFSASSNSSLKSAAGLKMNTHNITLRCCLPLQSFALEPRLSQYLPTVKWSWQDRSICFSSVRDWFSWAVFQQGVKLQIQWLLPQGRLFELSRERNWQICCFIAKTHTHTSHTGREIILWRKGEPILHCSQEKNYVRELSAHTLVSLCNTKSAQTAHKQKQKGKHLWTTQNQQKTLKGKELASWTCSVRHPAQGQAQCEQKTIPVYSLSPEPLLVWPKARERTELNCLKHDSLFPETSWNCP